MMKLANQKYFMKVAHAIRKERCLKRNVGAVMVLEGRVIGTGYNGTPSGYPNCNEGGCPRCSDPIKFPPGVGYDQCLCIHAESNCLLTAARFGVAVVGAWVFSTLEPCHTCLKSMLQAGIIGVRFAEGTSSYDDHNLVLLGKFPEKVLQHFVVEKE